MLFDARTVGKRRALALVGFFAAVGCAHSEGQRGASVTELNRTVQSLKAQNTAYQKQVEELENRVFIMSDQLESKRGPVERSASAPSLALPRVTLRPSERQTPPPEEEVASDPSGEVEYAGEAAKTTGKRPLLRMYGDDASVLPVVEPTRVSDRVPAARERVVEPDDREPKRLAVVPTESRKEPRAVEARSASARGGSIDSYRRSLEALRSGRHVEAAAGFREFLKHHPDHDFADNAQYWLGECYYDQKDYPMAVREFRRVVEKYAHGNKVADALLKVGFSHLALGSAEVGRQVIEQVVRSYPQHEAAVLAGAKLRELGPSATRPAGPRPEEKP